MNRRPRAVLAVLLVALASIAVRVAWLQTVSSPSLRAKALATRVTTAELPSLRGSIYDRDGKPLALSVPRHSVAVDGQAVTDTRSTAVTLASILKVDPGRVLAKLSLRTSFEYVAYDIDENVANAIKAAKIEGVVLVPGTIRSYPAGSMAGSLLGVTGWGGNGLEGLEFQWNDVLRGEPGRVTEERDPTGHPIPQAPSRIEPSVPGRSLVLTIDQELQFHAERTLEAAIKAYGARGGTVVVMNPRTGEILAMADAPFFSPANFDLVAEKARRNGPLTEVFEPGSTNKVITIAAALEERAIAPWQHLDVPDSYEVADETFHDSHPHPPQSLTMEGILVESSNVGTIKVAQQVGGRVIDEYLGRFGYGRTTGVGFPGEAEGIVLPYKDWSGTSIATIPIGQGIATSAIQMALVFATIANDGIRPMPSLVKGTVSAPGVTVEPAQSDDNPRRVISAATATSLRAMLAKVVTDGTGSAAAVAGYTVGGKTGTARIPGPYGYTDNYVSSFVGMAPATDPSLVVGVFLDEVSDKYHGGDSAAPVFSQVMDFSLRHLRVPIDT